MTEWKDTSAIKSINPHLIDAAPDMYDVLKSVLADIDGGMVTQGTINEIKYALARANGHD